MLMVCSLLGHGLQSCVKCCLLPKSIMRNLPGQHGLLTSQVLCTFASIELQTCLFVWYNSENILISAEMRFLLINFLFLIDTAYFLSIKMCSHRGVLKFRLNF